MIFLAVSKSERIPMTEQEYYGLVAELYEDHYPARVEGCKCFVCSPVIHIAERTLK